MKPLDANQKEDLMKIFNHLHENPEISWKEYKTTAYIKEILEAHGCRTKTFDDCPGVVGEIGEGKPVVALRADMDALWQEVDGVYRANHSCGHDSHMTMAIGAVKILTQQDQLPKGTIRFIFQPSEEKGTGALKMIEKGIVDDVDYLYGVHVRPIQETRFGHAASAILHGASQSIRGTIKGEDAHAARPHLGTNAIEVASTLLNELSHIHIDPMIPHSVKMTKLHAGGESHNIIPGQAEFTLDMRSQSNEVMASLVEHVKAAADSVANFYKVEIDLVIPSNLAAATMNTEAQELMADAICDVLGKENHDGALVTTGSEDFHFYPVKRPHLKATMLGLGCDLQPGLHHPHMTFRKEAMFYGMDILSKAVLKTLQKEERKGNE
ncbi:M20 peptidase aminoacylase family protein [Falsibacillus pallidus]|uniref:M20 peptidase aminoacylase family protein n=1 Tax=Falsibacillus pallidus TaxID=493781 RepID=UPI003D9702B3